MATVKFELHPAQQKIEEAFKSKRFIYVIAGRKFGKSYYAIRKAIIEAWRKPNAVVWYLAPYESQSFQISWMRFLQIIPREILKKAREDKKYIQLTNNSVVWIKGVQHETILRGENLDFAILDEFVNMPYYVWKSVLKPMFVVTQGKALFIGTVPDPRREYVSEEFLDDYEKYLNKPDEDNQAFNFSSFENPYIDKKTILKEIEEARNSGKADKEEWAKREYLGYYKREFGYVFDELDYRIHFVEPFEIPQSWIRIFAVDPHPNTPFASLWVAISPEDHYIVYREFQEEDLTLEQFARRVFEFEKKAKEHIILRLIDPTFANLELKTIGAKSVQQMLQMHGIYCKNANRDFNSFYFKMLQLIKRNAEGQTRFMVFKTCPITWYQITHLKWDVYHSRRRIEEGEVKYTARSGFFHFVDCLKYIINANITSTNVERIKEIKQLIKQIQKEA